MAVLIYRIEHPESGEGPYAGGDVCWGDHFPGSERHPSPEDDSGLEDFWLRLGFDERREWSFSFSSIAQLRAWFYQDSWLQAMHEAGFKLTVWEVEPGGWQLGHAQAIFRKADARKIREQDLIPAEALG